MPPNWGARIQARRRLRRRHRYAVAGVVLLLAAGVGAVTVSRRGADEAAKAGRDCGATVPVPVTVTAAYVPAIDEAAAHFEELDHRITGACLDVQVTTAAAEDLGTSAASEEAAQPAAFVTGPLDTEQVVGLLDAAGGEPSSTVIARSVTVIAVPQPLASTLRWADQPPAWGAVGETLLNAQTWTSLGRADLGTFRVALAGPAASPASLGALSAIAAVTRGVGVGELAATDLGTEQVQGALLGLVRQTTLATENQPALIDALHRADREGDLARTVSAALLDEQGVWTYNTADPRVALVPAYPSEGSFQIEVSYTQPSASGQPASVIEAARQFGEFLAGTDGQAVLTGTGLRGADGTVASGLVEGLGRTPDRDGRMLGLPTSPVRSGLYDGWHRMENPGRFLVLVDVSGSMREQVVGTGRSKLQFAQDAAIAGMELVPPTAEIGLWEFATRLQGSTDHRELVSIGPVGEVVTGRTRLGALVSAVRGLIPSTDTGLYDSALASFRAMSKDYGVGEPNVVVLLTDGRNDDPGSLSLKTLVATIRAEQDPERPVRFLTIAYGADADAASLAAIASASGGTAYSSPNPADIGRVFVRALTQA